MTNGKLSFSDSKITQISGNSFTYSSVRSLYIPSTITHLDRDSFFHCEQLETISIDLPINSKQFTLIGMKSLMNCNIQSFKIVENGILNLTETGRTAVESLEFEDTYFKGILISDQITSLFPACFKQNPQLQYVSLPTNVQLNNNSIFFHCSNIQVIKVGGISVFENGVFDCSNTKLTNFGIQTFSGLSTISKLVISANIGIEKNCFENCINLRTIVFKSVNGINLGNEIFTSSNNLNEIIYDGVSCEDLKNINYTQIFLGSDSNLEQFDSWCSAISSESSTEESTNSSNHHLIAIILSLVGLVVIILIGLVLYLFLRRKRNSYTIRLLAEDQSTYQDLS